MNGINRNSVSADIFRAYDIRGIVDKSLSIETVKLVGQAVASEAIKRGQDKIAIARDGRLHSPKLSAALAEGIQTGGLDVIDIGMVPTPVLYFATHKLGTTTGIMVTGSHNPPEYNGLKMVIAGETIYGDTITSLYDRIINGDLETGNGSYTEQNMVAEYIDTILGDVKVNRKMKIAVDCGNGVAGVIAPELFKRLGCEIVELFCDVDGTFPNHHPDPSRPENLEDLKNCVQENNLDLGLAFDGDGDRVGIIDNECNLIWPDRLMMLYSRDVLSRNPGAQIILDIKSSSHLSQVISELGGQPLMWKTGHSFIKAKMKETGALLAGEMSGHIFFKERWFGFDDGLYSATRMLEILSASERPTCEIFSELPDSFNTPEINIPFEEGEHFRFMEKFSNKATFIGGEILAIDGLRVNYPDGWGLIRPSNTTPCLVLRFEADSNGALEKIQDIFREQIRNIDDSLDIPF